MNNPGASIAMHMHAQAMHQSQHAAHQATATAMRMQHQAMRTARQAAARGASMARRQSQMLANDKRRAAYHARVAQHAERIKAIHASLQAAVAAPLICHPHPHSHGASLFLQANWKNEKGEDRVVLTCNALAPGSGRPVAAHLWTDKGMEAVDLVEESMADCVHRGRLFLFSSTVMFEEGESYAVLPVNAQESDGKPGFWTFANVGLYRDKLFYTGTNGVGYFLGSEHPSLLVTRPLTYLENDKVWVWYGRSSATERGRLKVVAPFLFSQDHDASRTFLVPAVDAERGLMTLRSQAFDSHGDPIGILETAPPPPPFGVSFIDGNAWFHATPNRKDNAGRLLFAGKAEPRGKEWVFPASVDTNAEDAEVEIPANHQDTAGLHWFVKYANARDRKSGLPIILIPLRSA